MKRRRVVEFIVRRASFAEGGWFASAAIVGGRCADVYLNPSRDRAIDMAAAVGGLLGVPATTCAEARALLEADRGATEVSLAFR